MHLVPRGAEALVRLFGSTTGDQVDKFDRCEWATGPGAVPLLAACPSRLVCRVMDRVAAGDHLARLVEVEDADAGPEPVFTLSMAKAMAVQPGHPA